MKLKRRIGIGLAVAAATYCVLAYIFMWPPVVTDYYKPWPLLPARAEPDKSACINNLRQIDIAINQYAAEHNKHAGDTVTMADITPYLKLNTQGRIPSCPMGGKYGVTSIGEPPSCSYVPFTHVRIGYFHYLSEPQHTLP